MNHMKEGFNVDGENSVESCFIHLEQWLVFMRVSADPMVSTIQMATATVFFSVFWQAITFNISGKPLKVIWIVLPVLFVAGSVGVFVTGALGHHSMR